MIAIDPGQAWKELKWGMFSASKEFLLLTPGKYDKLTNTTPMFGDGAVSYIRKVARQAYTIFNEEDEPETYSMKMGKAKEHISFNELCKQLGRRDALTYYGGLNPLFEPYKPYKADSGTSPDSVAWKDEGARIALFGAELKNPSGDMHGYYLEKIRDDKDLKKVSLEYFTQCQKAMMTFGCDSWLWCSHNEYFRGRDRMLIIHVSEDKNFQNELDAKLHSAIKMKHDIMDGWRNRVIN